MPLDGQRDIATRLAIAALVGLAAGLEREWSGHASGPDARFAGLRTFCLLGLLGGVAGILASSSQVQMATAMPPKNRIAVSEPSTFDSAPLALSEPSPLRSHRSRMAMTMARIV